MEHPDIRIVLVEPSHPGNIGAAARSMKTMGLGQLVLVRPADFPSEEAERRAVAASDVLERAHVVNDLADAIGDCRLVIGTTGRTREYPLPCLDARSAGVQIARESAEGVAVAVLFGTERDGLSNESLDACTHTLQIPTGPNLKSLNLAAAVQLVSYEILMGQNEKRAPADAVSADDFPTQSEMEFFFVRFREILDDRHYFDSVNGHPTFTKIRRMLTRARPNENELRLLHGLVGLMGLADRPPRRD